MLLNAPGTARLTAVLMLSLAPLLLSACGVRLDDSRTARKPRPAGEPEEVQPMQGDGALRRGSVLGLRPDNTARAKWLERADRIAGDPKMRPSYGDMRQARALAMAEAEIIAKGGNIRVTSNGASSEPSRVTYVHAPGALTMTIKASDCLNSVDGIPHALALSVYHLTDRVAVDSLSQSPEGIATLLAGEKFDASVVTAKTVYLQPGMSTRLVLDRPEKGRYVAFAAGYHNATASGAVYVSEYGLGVYLASGATVLHNRKRMYQPLPLNFEVTLGDDAMSVFNNDAIYHFSHRAINMTERQMYQALYNKHRVADTYMDGLTNFGDD